MQVSMFCGAELLKITKKIRLIELFAGIGAQAKALENIGADFEHYRICEFDKYAVASYNAIHGTDFKTSDKSKAQAGLFKAMGLKSGVPDLFLPVARQCYHGLFIEMKTSKGVLSKNQEWWLFELQKQGYRVDIARSCEEAIEGLKEYICNR